VRRDASVLHDRRTPRKVAESGSFSTLFSASVHLCKALLCALILGLPGNNQPAQGTRPCFHGASLSLFETIYKKAKTVARNRKKLGSLAQPRFDSADLRA
jgi:hypothetical protein